MTTIDAHQHFWQLARFAYQWLQAEALRPSGATVCPLTCSR